MIMTQTYNHKIIEKWENEDNFTVLQSLIKAEGNDTSEIIFAITDLLKIPFTPQIKNIKDHTLYGFKDLADYQNLGYVVLPSAKINQSLIKEQWDNILRLIVTIKTKYSPIPELIQKLSRSKQNPIYLGLTEYGKIIKTTFLLKEINKIESK